jgi:RimJ/RimL family protein N-acetyltransferase
VLVSPALSLHRWEEKYRTPFYALHSDHEVMLDLGGPYGLEKCHEKFDRYSNAWDQNGTSRWAIEDISGVFIGYVGVMYHADVSHPMGPHHEIGGRLCRHAWGKGYARKGALLALEHAWHTLNVGEIVSYTSPKNVRSQRVMSAIGLTREKVRDFTAVYDDQNSPWTGWVWVIQRPS